MGEILVLDFLVVVSRVKKLQTRGNRKKLIRLYQRNEDTLSLWSGTQCLGRDLRGSNLLRNCIASGYETVEQGTAAKAFGSVTGQLGMTVCRLSISADRLRPLVQLLRGPDLCHKQEPPCCSPLVAAVTPLRPRLRLLLSRHAPTHPSQGAFTSAQPWAAIFPLVKQLPGTLTQPV